jgi:hypothetical protein
LPDASHSHILHDDMGNVRQFELGARCDNIEAEEHITALAEEPNYIAVGVLKSVPSRNP